MSKGLLAFAAGFGGGYLQQKRQDELDAERKEDRANRQQEFDARMDEVKQAKSLRLGLADATRPVAVNDNAAMLDVSGKPTVYEDAGVASSDYRQARTMGLADVQPPRQTAAVNGKAYGTTGEADAAAVAYNQPAAQQQRVSQAYGSAGKPMEAMQHQSGLASLKAGQTSQAMNELRLNDEQTKHADDAANRLFMGDVQKNGGDVFKTLATTITNSNLPGMAGMKAENRVSADGKTSQIVMASQDGGPERILKSYSNDDKGQMQAQQDFMKVDPMRKIQWAHERSVEEQKQKNFEAEQGRKVKADDGKYEYQMGNLQNRADQNDIREKLIDMKNATGSGAAGNKEALSFINEQRKHITSESQAIKDLLKTDLKDVISPKKQAEIRAQYQPQLDAIETRRRALDADFEFVARKAGLREGAPPPPGLASATPSGAGIPTEAAARTAVNSGGMGADPKAIARELAASEASLPTLAKDPVALAAMQSHIAEMKRQGANAGLASARPAATGTPKAGLVKDGYRFKGGNPADPKSWEKV